MCEMGRPLSLVKPRLDFSAFPSIAILQAERLIERRIKVESGERKAGTPTEVFDHDGLDERNAVKGYY